MKGNTNIDDFVGRLPAECRGISIQSRCRTALQHFEVGNDMVVVLLTKMPGDRCRAWRMRKCEYWHLQPRYGSRDRYIRENMPPTMEGRTNELPAPELSLF